MKTYGGKRTFHGMSGTKTHRAWADMLQRCLNPSNKQYRDYGGRGISVCKRWLTFVNFFTDMGIAPKGLALDRKNNNRGYSSRNCQWATRRQQESNKRNTPLLRYKGQTKTLMQWARSTGINHITLRARVRYGWDTKRALSEPIKPKKLIHPRWRKGENLVPRNERIRAKTSRKGN